MAAITIKKLPDQLHQQLKRRAVRHHRSLNNEFIACLEKALGWGGDEAPGLMLEKAAASRESLKNIHLRQDEMDDLKNKGRN